MDTSAWGPSVGSLLPSWLPCSAQTSRTPRVRAETVGFAVAELVLPARVPASTARRLVRLLAGRWKMDVLLALAQAVHSAAICLHESTSLAAE